MDDFGWLSRVMICSTEGQGCKRWNLQLGRSVIRATSGVAAVPPGRHAITNVVIVPMSYPGGKGHAFTHVINQMPPHQVYIETHLGGASVLANKKPAPF